MLSSLWLTKPINQAHPYIYSLRPRLLYLVRCLHGHRGKFQPFIPPVPTTMRRSEASVQVARRCTTVFPISRLTEMIRSGCNAFMVPCLTVPRPSRFHPVLHDPLDVLRRPKDSVLCNRAPCSRVRLCSTSRHPRFVDHRT